MRLDRFDLNLLVVFETIYSTGNLTRAADRLHLAQPTVSNALARLRTQFDDPLFVRAGKGVTPTPTATRMIGPIRQSLRQMQQTLDGQIDFNPALSQREFRISMGELVASSLLPPLLEAIGNTAPDIRLHVFQMDRKEINSACAAGALDLAVDIARLSTSTLNRESILRDEYVCGLRKGHHAASGRLTLKRFLALDLISVSSRLSGSSLLDIALNRVGARFEPKLRTQFYLPALRIVGGSDYAIVAPRALVEQSGLVAKQLPFETGFEELSLYWHRSADGDPANVWMRDMILQHFA